MRNLHLHIERKFGKESIILLWQWEHVVRKIREYGKHRRFSCDCQQALLQLVSDLRTMSECQ